MVISILGMSPSFDVSAGSKATRNGDPRMCEGTFAMPAQLPGTSVSVKGANEDAPIARFPMARADLQGRTRSA